MTRPAIKTAVITDLHRMLVVAGLDAADRDA
jgi:hypothetical protein